MGKHSTRKSSTRKSNNKPKNVKKVKKMIEVEEEVEVEDNTAIEEAIRYCAEVKDVYKNFDYNVLKDKQAYDKLEVISRKNERVPFVIRFARYRIVVKSYFNNTKEDALKQCETLGFNWESRDLGNAETKSTIWYSKVYRPDYEPDFNTFKMWLDYLCDGTKPQPKISINKNHF